MTLLCRHAVGYITPLTPPLTPSYGLFAMRGFTILLLSSVIVWVARLLLIHINIITITIVTVRVIVAILFTATPGYVTARRHIVIIYWHINMHFMHMGMFSLLLFQYAWLRCSLAITLHAITRYRHAIVNGFPLYAFALIHIFTIIAIVIFFHITYYYFIVGVILLYYYFSSHRKWCYGYTYYLHVTTHYIHWVITTTLHYIHKSMAAAYWLITLLLPAITPCFIYGDIGYTVVMLLFGILTWLSRHTHYCHII